jgi:hypothetical protein
MHLDTLSVWAACLPPQPAVIEKQPANKRTKRAKDGESILGLLGVSLVDGG